MTRALVLQHIRCEPPGMFSGMLTDRGLAIETIELDEGAELPDWRDADLVLAMGGPMSVHDEAAHPWLAVEKRWIAAAVRAGVPYFGVCLGAQLLAASLGAPVHTGETPEVGVLPVAATVAADGDPVLSSAVSSLPCNGMVTRSASRPERSTSPGRGPTPIRRSGSARRRMPSSSMSR